MPTPKLGYVETEYEGVALKTRRYSHTPSATRDDDGIIDVVAVRRVIDGDDNVTLSGREVVAVVIEFARRGADDGASSARLGMSEDGVHKIRKRHEITIAKRAEAIGSHVAIYHLRNTRNGRGYRRDETLSNRGQTIFSPGYFPGLAI